MKELDGTFLKLLPAQVVVPWDTMEAFLQIILWLICLVTKYPLYDLLILQGPSNIKCQVLVSCDIVKKRNRNQLSTKTMVLALTTATQLSTKPLPEPILTSKGFFVFPK